MANKKKSLSDQLIDGLGKAAVTIVVTTATTIVTKIVEQVEKKMEDRDKMVKVPELYSPGFPCTLDQVDTVLVSAGFHYVTTAETKPDAKYHDCIPMQVVSTNPSAHASVLPGSTIQVKYVTQDVIEESKIIFENQQRELAEKKQLKLELKAVRKEKRDQQIEDMRIKVKQLPAVFKKDKIADAADKEPNE